MLVTLADQCDYKLMQYREEEKLESKIFIFSAFVVNNMLLQKHSKKSLHFLFCSA